MPLTKVKYWSSSPLIVRDRDDGRGHVSADVMSRQHLVLMTVQLGQQLPKTVRIASAINGAVSKRIADLLDKSEGQ